MQNMRREYTVVSRFDRFGEQCKYSQNTEFFNERNCFQQDPKPENLACHRLSLIILFVQSNKDLWLAFCAVYIVHMCPEGQMMLFFFKTLLPNKLEAINSFFFSGIINLLFDGLTYNTRRHFAHCLYFSNATHKISTLIIC